MARQVLGPGSRADRCPLLACEAVQSCTVAPVHKLVPSNATLRSSCRDDAHRHCAVFLQRTRAATPVAAAAALVPEVPARLVCARNHLWLDLEADGRCHVGVDAFVAYVLGRVDHISFLSRETEAWPAAVLSVQDVDLRMVFPRRIQVTGSNVHLRVDPQWLVADPYGAGWLYSGVTTSETLAMTPGLTDLVPAAEVPAWMQGEVGRLDRFVRGELPGAAEAADATRWAADGGHVLPGIARHLERAQVLRLYHAFFALHGDGRS